MGSHKAPRCTKSIASGQLIRLVNTFLWRYINGIMWRQYYYLLLICFLHYVSVTNKPNVAGYAYCTIVVYVVSILVTIIKKKSNQNQSVYLVSQLVVMAGVRWKYTICLRYDRTILVQYKINIDMSFATWELAKLCNVRTHSCNSASEMQHCVEHITSIPILFLTQIDFKLI